MNGSDFFLVAWIALMAPHLDERDAKYLTFFCIFMSLVFWIAE